jgi:hypothetical protein
VTVEIIVYWDATPCRLHFQGKSERRVRWIVAGPRQHSHTWFLVPLDSWLWESCSPQSQCGKKWYGYRGRSGHSRSLELTSVYIRNTDFLTAVGSLKAPHSYYTPVLIYFHARLIILPWRWSFMIAREILFPPWSPLPSVRVFRGAISSCRPVHSQFHPRPVQFAVCTWLPTDATQPVLWMQKSVIVLAYNFLI